MLDTISLDQLRMLVAVFDLGNFSAAARSLGRVQSAVSHAMANLERDLGFPIWDRSTRIPTPTPAGETIAAAARRVIAEAARLRRIAAGIAGGAEPSITICFDQLFPTRAIVDLCRDFAAAFPDVPLRVESETLGAVHERVRSGACQLGVGIALDGVPGLVARHLGAIAMVPVAAASHPLAAAPGEAVDRATLSEFVQVVLSERQPDTSPDRGVLSTETWRVADLHTKGQLIRAGLGWGNMPRHAIDEDLAAGRLVELAPEGWPPGGVTLAVNLVMREDLAPGPATTWVSRTLEGHCSLSTHDSER
jgi:DNA-binding transcriptional LysR family regulator